MPEQAAPELLAQLRRQGDTPVRRIADDQIEAFTRGRLLQAVAHTHDGPQPCSRLATQVAERRIEEHLRHPRREGVPLESVQPALNALERDSRVAVLQTRRHAPCHRRQECTPAAGRVEHARRIPVDTGLRRHVQQPLAQRWRRVVGPQSGSEPVRHQCGVEHSDRVAGVQDIQPGRGDSNPLRLLFDLLRHGSKPDIGRQSPQRPPSPGDGLQFLPVCGHHANDDRPREVQPLLMPDRGCQLPDARRRVFHNRPRQWLREHACPPAQVHRPRRHDVSFPCFNVPKGVARRTESAEAADPRFRDAPGTR